MRNQILILPCFLSLLAFSCKKNGNQPGNGGDSSVVKIAPDGFGFNNTRQVAINIQLLAPDSKPVTGVPVSVYSGNVAMLDNGSAAPGSAIFTGLSDKNGYVKATVNLPATMDTVLIDAKYTGLLRNAKAFINGGSVDAVIGGPDGFSGNVVEGLMQAGSQKQPRTSSFGPATTYISMGDVEGNGRPKYLESHNGSVTSSLLSYINASLPAGMPLTTSHPQYLSASATNVLNITATSDVYVTFVSDAASYKNSLGYYTYPTGTPPQNPSDISNIYLVFPNASLHGSGGGMHTGDQVKLGTFDAGTSIGFVLFANGWAGKGDVNTKAVQYFSNDNLNPEADAQNKRHSVEMYDADENAYIIGFEDMPRPTGTQDFNSVVFYASSSVANSISGNGVQPIDKPVDTDGDGVSNIFDQYPTDATRAYDNYYPSQGTFGTLAFEDLWPATGDYDMNDLVVNYRYKFVSNAANGVVEVYGDYAVQAAGASFQNGFGVQFPFAASQVKTVTGQKLTSNYITTASNGVEAGQTKAVIIPFDNHTDLINNYAGAFFINTKNDLPKVTGDTAHVYVQFTSPISASTLGTAPFNPFLISNMRRQYEIHLPNNEPTDLAGSKLLGTGDDASVPSSGVYYVSKSNWPWALNFAGSFTYPLEGVKISDAYLHFLDWAKSGGATFTDWDTNTGSDYRNTSNLYTK